MAACLVATPLAAQEKPQRGGFNKAQWEAAVGIGGQNDGLFGGRARNRRPTEHRASIDGGLAWLARAQREDGNWVIEGSADATVAVTSLAVLAMLGDGNTMRAGPHKGAVKTGIKWLREQQAVDGAFAEATGPHILATLAFSEAFILSNYTLLKPICAKGLTCLAGRRHPDGGWRTTTDAEHSDPSLTLWAVTLLATGSGFGLVKSDAPLEGVSDWMAGPRATSVRDHGILGFPVPPARQAEVANDQVMANVFTRYWLGIRSHAKAQKIALERARSLPREWAAGPGRKLSINEWYCSTHALVQAGDEAVVNAICAALASKQVAEGDERGSWDPIDVWGKAGGRVWMTAMAVLVLEAPYRYRKGLLR